MSLKKTAFILASNFLLIFSINSYAFDIQGSYQEYEGENAKLTMEKTNKSTQAINNASAEQDGLQIQRLKIDKELEMKMKNAENSVQCGNHATTSASKAGVGQFAKVKNLTMAQEGGKGNTQAVNCVEIKKN